MGFYYNNDTHTNSLKKGSPPYLLNANPMSQEYTMDIFNHHFKGDNTRFCSRIAYFTVGLIILMASLLLFLPLLSHHFSCSDLNCCHDSTSFSNPSIYENCSFDLVESIPENLTFPDGSIQSMSTYDAWMYLLNNAKTSVDLVSFYWTMRGSQEFNDSSDWQGEEVFKELLNLMKRDVKLRVIVNKNEHASTSDISSLVEAGAEVLYLDSEKLFGSGVLHTKLWVVDKKMMYIGSANMDWRALTQVKELGTLIKSCDTLLSDAQKLIDVYQYASTHDSVPTSWPCRFKTRYNRENPMQLLVNNVDAQVYLSSSPPPLCPSGRMTDLNAILDIILSAKKFVHIAVMDYAVNTWFMKPNVFWPAIDNALRKVIIEKKIEVKILTSLWAHVKPEMIFYLKSLASLDGMGEGKHKSSIESKMFCVPIFMPHQRSIPFSRVNHNKYMVTDEVAYIGTSNWSGDYFISTSGVGLIVKQSDTSKKQQHNRNDVEFRQQLENIFERDWYSNYSVNVWDVDMNDLKVSCNSALKYY